MSKDTITGLVERVERIGRTYYGNPIIRVYVHTGDMATTGVYRISDNSALVYEIENPEFKSEPHTFALTRAGRISHRVHS